MTDTATRRTRTLRSNQTDAEYRLWYELANRRLGGHKFVRQFAVGPFIVDFACRAKHLVVELDGSQHASSKTDAARTGALNIAGWSVLRFWNDEVLREREAVCETILAVLEGRIVERGDGSGLLHGLRFDPSSRLRELPVRGLSRLPILSPSSPAGPSPCEGEEPFVVGSHPSAKVAGRSALPLSRGERVAAQRPGEGDGSDAGGRAQAAQTLKTRSEPHP